MLKISLLASSMMDVTSFITAFGSRNNPGVRNITGTSGHLPRVCRRASANSSRSVDNVTQNTLNSGMPRALFQRR